MTLTDYMNPEKFPATSQKGLSPQEQLRIDAFNYDQIEEAIGRGLPMNKMQEDAWEELQAKRPWMAELTRQIAAAKKNDKKQEMMPEPIINSDIDDIPVNELIDDDDNYAAHLGNAIMAIINNDDLSTAEKRKQILGGLKLLEEEEEEMPEMAPPPMINTDINETTEEAFESDRPFKKLSPEETKSMCEQVVSFQKVMKEQLERDRKTYREMYGEEMPEM